MFKFLLTWSCVSLPRSTTSSEWKLLYLFNLKANILLITVIENETNFTLGLLLKQTFHSQWQWFDLLINRINIYIGLHEKLYMPNLSQLLIIGIYIAPACLLGTGHFHLPGGENFICFSRWIMTRRNAWGFVNLSMEMSILGCPSWKAAQRYGLWGGEVIAYGELLQRVWPNYHRKLAQLWLNSEPIFSTLAQHWIKIPVHKTVLRCTSITSMAQWHICSCNLIENDIYRDNT